MSTQIKIWFCFIKRTLFHNLFSRKLPIQWYQRQNEHTTIHNVNYIQEHFYLFIYLKKNSAVIETCRAWFVLIYFCHSVFLDIASPSLIYIQDNTHKQAVSALVHLWKISVTLGQVLCLCSGHMKERVMSLQSPHTHIKYSHWKGLSASNWQMHFIKLTSYWWP